MNNKKVINRIQDLGALIALVLLVVAVSYTHLGIMTTRWCRCGFAGETGIYRDRGGSLSRGAFHFHDCGGRKTG